VFGLVLVQVQVAGEREEGVSQTHYIDKVLNKFSHFHDKISHIL
jgi:hypothetical protein